MTSGHSLGLVVLLLLLVVLMEKGVASCVRRS
jgi:hypothetical protein